MINSDNVTIVAFAGGEIAYTYGSPLVICVTCGQDSLQSYMVSVKLQ